MLAGWDEGGYFSAVAPRIRTRTRPPAGWSPAGGPVGHTRRPGGPHLPRGGQELVSAGLHALIATMVLRGDDLVARARASRSRGDRARSPGPSGRDRRSSTPPIRSARVTGFSAGTR